MPSFSGSSLFHIFLPHRESIEACPPLSCLSWTWLGSRQLGGQSVSKCLKPCSKPSETAREKRIHHIKHEIDVKSFVHLESFCDAQGIGGPSGSGDGEVLSTVRGRRCQVRCSQKSVHHTTPSNLVAVTNHTQRH